MKCTVFSVVVMSAVGICSALSAGCGQRLLVIAHRGYSSHYPENTLSSFRGGIEAGADYIELDAQPSADGTLYVLHDYTLDRTTNALKVIGGQKINIKDVHDATLDQLDAGAWFNPRFGGERLPTLSAALDVIQVNSKTLLERKTGTPETYVKLLREKKLVGKLMVQSFDWDFLAALHKLLPEQALAALGDKQLDDQRWHKLVGVGVKTVAWGYKDLSADLVKRLHGQGFQVFAWTTDQPAEWATLVGYGVNGIITNRAAELREWLARPSSR